LNPSGGKVSASSSQLWRIDSAIAPLLTIPLKVVVHQFKKPCIYVGFVNLATDEHKVNEGLFSWWGEALGAGHRIEAII
jgi:hypothetical protein